MADLNQACANLGLDSRKLRPIAHATATGRVAVYIGAAWQELPLGKALNLRDQLSAAIEKLQPGPVRAVAITAEMIHEMEAHLPLDVRALGIRESWQWKADFLNRAMHAPDEPCMCCGVTPNGGLPDDLAEVSHG